MYPTLFHIGPLTIYTYGFMIFLGVLAAYCLTLRAAPRYGMSADGVSDLFFWTLLSGFGGARLTFILVNFTAFLRDPLPFIFSNSGFVFFGGFFAALAALTIYARHKSYDLWSLFDLLAPGAALAHGFGRIGCFFFGCCYGMHAEGPLCFLFPPDSPAGMEGVPVLATQLISAAFLFMLSAGLLTLRRLSLPAGTVASLYLIVYGLFRFTIEFFRIDPRGFWFGFSTSQWFSIAAVILGFFLLLRLRRSLLDQ
jgi:phosphatidylglycerol:prolipoprotein diacylglycerol transferase